MLWKSCCAALLLLGCIVPSRGQTFEGRELVKASLVADTTAIVPGQPFTVGLLLETEPAWHTYWQYAGDSGLPTKIDWKLPDGFKADDLEWPLPEKETDAGDVQVYAYGTEVLLLTKITPPSTLPEGEIKLQAHASWLVCKEECIPADSDLSLPLPVAKSASPANRPLFDKYLAKLPKTSGAPFQLRWTKEKNGLVAHLTGLPEKTAVDFYPIPRGESVLAHPKVTKTAAGADILLPIQSPPPWPAAVPGIIVTWPEGNPENRSGWVVKETTGPPAPGGLPGAGAGAELVQSANPVGLATALLFGFIGGLILNLMPCVLPVIALKIFGFIKQAGEEPARVFQLGMSFVGGIFAWFLGLAALIAGFKAAGHDLNWSFQFQNPWFLLGMSAIVFVFALNLFGVFEVFLPSTAGSKMLDLAQREGCPGAFLHGVFATLLATPCTAPFLGSALGFAFAAKAGVIFLVFASIAFGMSFPYIILAVRPGWTRFLPKPGNWMVQVKQFMGFLLMGTVIWLLWIIGTELGVDGIAWTAAFLLALGIACWIKGSFVNPGMSGLSRVMGGIAIIVIVAGAFAVFIWDKFASAHAADAQATATTEGGVTWQPFTPATLEQSVAGTKPVFIDFTAAWCLTCKQNEIFVLGTPAVRNAFKERGVVALKGDWTSGDPAITKMLKQFGRAGVPLYVVYPPGSLQNPIVLPELLTQGMVLDALAKAAGTGN